MLFVSFCLDHFRAVIGVLLAVWTTAVPKSETVLASVFIVAFVETVSYGVGEKDKKFPLSLLPVPIIIVVSTFLFAFTAIIFGAPILSDTENTLLFGLLLSALTVYPVALTSGGSITRISDTFLDFVAETPAQQWQLGAAAGAVVGAWCGAFAIPLDWDRPWQVWPVPCCAAAHLGSAVGRLCARRLCAPPAGWKDK